MKLKIFYLCIFLFIAIQLPAQNTNWKKEYISYKGPAAQVEWLVKEARKPENANLALAMLQQAEQIAAKSKIDTSLGMAYVQIGWYYQAISDPVTSMKNFVRGKNYYLKAHHFTGAGKGLYGAITVLAQQYLNDSVIHVIKRNDAWIKVIPDMKTRMRIYSMIGVSYIQKRQTDEALKTYNDILPDIERSLDTQLILSTYSNVGALQASFDSSMIWYKKGLKLSKDKYPANYVNLLFNIGYLYNSLDNAGRDSALVYLLETEKYINDFQRPVFKVQLYNTLGAYFYYEKEFKMALPYFQKSLLLIDPFSESMRNEVLNNLCMSFINLKQRDSATYYMNLLEQRTPLSTDDYDHILFYQTKAYYVGMGKDSCSKDVLTNNVRALEYSVNMGESRLGQALIEKVGYCLSNASASDPDIKRLALSAIKSIDFFYQQSSEEPNLLWVSSMINVYAQLEERYGNKDHALTLYKELTEVNAKIDAEKYDKDLKTGMIKYKSEQKDAEIALLREQEKASAFRTTMTIVGLIAVTLIAVLIFVLYRRENKSKALLDERNHKVEQLLREVHHRVKNNLQIVSSFIHIQLDKINDYKAEQVLKDTSTRIIALAGLHQSLYRQDDLSRIQLKDYIEDLCDTLKTTIDNNVVIHCDLQELSLDIDRAIPIGLAINELITNAVKYAFTNKDNGEIKVVLMQKDNWELQVKDNGKGLPDSLDPDQLQSIGIRLVQDIAQHQLKGNFSFHNDNGAVFRIDFAA